MSAYDDQPCPECGDRPYPGSAFCYLCILVDVSIPDPSDPDDDRLCLWCSGHEGPAVYHRAGRLCPDLRRARAFAARWLAETEHGEPPTSWPTTDANLAQMFAGCVKPARRGLYPLIREQLLDRSWLELDPDPDDATCRRCGGAIFQGTWEWFHEERTSCPLAEPETGP